jgi:hypothetical protein
MKIRQDLVQIDGQAGFHVENPPVNNLRGIDAATLTQAKTTKGRAS